jgi:catechol 2,3-dioxygenase-like lactoylglutathione lyase family enzyme
VTNTTAGQPPGAPSKEENMISKLDFVAVPSQDADRSRAFYVDTLGLKPDAKADYEFWVGDTCFGIWEPERFGMEFAPQSNGHPALHVDDVDAAREQLEAKGVEFLGETLDTGACHMAFLKDPDGNDLMLHRRYAPVD